jgi:hypothetical protein
MFDVGQKIVCVDGSFPHAVLNYMRQLPVEGKVYTVRDVIPAQGWDAKETCAILLSECRNAPAPHRKEWGECGFAPHRFRELNTDEALAVAVLAENGVAVNRGPVHINCRCVITKDIS